VVFDAIRELKKPPPGTKKRKIGFGGERRDKSIVDAHKVSADIVKMGG
jgi:hypothetical protein